MGNSRISLILIGFVSFLALTFSLAVPAQANSKTAPEGADKEISFALVNTGDLPSDGEFQLHDLVDSGVDEADVRRLAEGDDSAPTADAPAEPLQQNPYEVVERWQDKDDWDTLIRHGRLNAAGEGFGLEKIDRKHNLSVDVVQATTMYPRPDATGKQHISGQKYRYLTEVWNVQCEGWWFWRDCEIVDEITVRADVDFRNARGESFGVVNAFCEGYQGRCPDWVRNAINLP